MLWILETTKNPNHVMLGIFLLATMIFITLQIKNKTETIIYFNLFILTITTMLIKNDDFLLLIILLPILVSSLSVRICFLIKNLIKE